MSFPTPRKREAEGFEPAALVRSPRARHSGDGAARANDGPPWQGTARARAPRLAREGGRGVGGESLGGGNAAARPLLGSTAA